MIRVELRIEPQHTAEPRSKAGIGLSATSPGLMPISRDGSIRVLGALGALHL